MSTESDIINWEKVFGKKINSEFCKILDNVFQNKLIKGDEDNLYFLDNHETSVVRNIPRFVPSDQYATSFSYQWSTFTKTQLDSAQGSSLAENDVTNKTGLSPVDVKGKLLLDAGVGIARHAEIFAKWGAFIIGIDLSDAVEAAKENLVTFDNAVVIQANIAELPFKPDIFDHIVSIGVLHHTPNTRQYTEHLMRYVRPMGRISIWLYPPGFSRRAEWVPLVSKLPMLGFKDWCEWITDVSRANRGNAWLEAFIRQFPYSTMHGTSERSVLALFDGYTPTYHWTHSAEEVERWFIEAGFSNIKTCRIPTSVIATKSMKKIETVIHSDVSNDFSEKISTQMINSRPDLNAFYVPEAISKLTIEITTWCNLKCAGCPRTTGIEQDNWDDIHMSLDCFGRILDNLPQIGFVTLHGIGEPTLHPQFNEMVAMAKKSGKFQRMKMTTNALARSIEYYRQSVVAGLDEFWISVDSFNQKICDKMREGTLSEKLKRRIKALIDAKLPVHISMVVSAVNYKDIPNTLRTLHDIGAPPVHMQEFQDFGDAYGLLNKAQRIDFFNSLTELMPQLNGMQIYPPSFVRPPGEICTAPWFRPAITVQGYLTPCCTTFDPEQFNYANIEQSTFSELWLSDGIKNWISKFVKNETAICSGCGLNPRVFGLDGELGNSGKTGNETHVVNAKMVKIGDKLLP